MHMHAWQGQFVGQWHIAKKVTETDFTPFFDMILKLSPFESPNGLAKLDENFLEASEYQAMEIRRKKA